MDLELKGFLTYQEFRTLNIVQIEEKFGMDWLHKINSSLIVAKESSLLYMPLGSNSMHHKNGDLHP